MTIGKNSRMSSVRSSIRAPKFLDKSSGFYGRLDEPETTGDSEGFHWDGRRGGATEGGLTGPSVTGQREETGAFEASGGLMEGDGETLLDSKDSRRSRRWRRSSSSRRRQREEGAQGGEGGEGGEHQPTARDQRPSRDEGERQTEPALVHFPLREEADDQVLIRDKKRGREEEEDEEERRRRRETEEGMKMLKRNTLNNYRKALDRALRRGWEAFISNLYSVTLTPVTSPSSPASKKKHRHNSVLAEFQ